MCWHSFVPGSCQEQPRPGLCWRLIKKKDPVAVTQQLKTFTQLGPSNPEATLSYCMDLHQGDGRMLVGDGRGPGAPGGNVGGLWMERRIMTLNWVLLWNFPPPAPDEGTCWGILLALWRYNVASTTQAVLLFAGGFWFIPWRNAKKLHSWSIKPGLKSNFWHNAHNYSIDKIKQTGCGPGNTFLYKWHK